MIRSLEYFWCQRANFHELLTTKLTSYRPKNTRTDRLLAVVVQKNTSITIEADVYKRQVPDGFFADDNARCRPDGVEYE